MAGQIKITITADGETEVSVNGVKGKSCEALTADLEAALGGSKDKKRTREYTETAREQGRSATR